MADLSAAGGRLFMADLGGMTAPMRHAIGEIVLLVMLFGLWRAFQADRTKRNRDT